MAKENALERLKSRNALIAELVVLWSVVRGVIDSISSFDTVKDHMNQIIQIFHFVVSPAGNLATFAIGLGWLAFVIFREPNSEPDAVITGNSLNIPAVRRSTGGDLIKAEIEDMFVNIEHKWHEAERYYSLLVNAWNETGDQEVAAFNKVLRASGLSAEEFMADFSKHEEDLVKVMRPIVETFVASTAHPIATLRSNLLSIEHQLSHIESYRKANDGHPPPNERRI